MKRSIAIAAVAVSAVLAGGTALALTNGEPRGGESREGAEHVRVAVRADDADRVDDADDTGRADRPTVTTSDLTVAQAIDAALKSRPGTVLSADLDTDDDDAGRGWEVEILAGDKKTYEVRVDPATGKVLTTHLAPDTHRAPQGLTARQGRRGHRPQGHGRLRRLRRRPQRHLGGRDPRRPGQGAGLEREREERNGHGGPGGLRSGRAEAGPQPPPVPS